LDNLFSIAFCGCATKFLPQILQIFADFSEGKIKKRICVNLQNLREEKLNLLVNEL